MLEKLELLNFRRHQDLEVEFSDGMNLIVGPNYSGKTTILQGVLYALYGPTVVPGGSASVTRRGSKGHRARLHLNLGGDSLVVERSKNGATVHRNGDLVASSATAVAEHLEQVFGFTSKQFMMTRYARQGSTKGLIGIGASEVQKVVEDISGTTILGQVASWAKAQELTSGAQIEALQTSHGDLQIEAMEEALTQREAEAKKLSARFSELSAGLPDLETEAAEAEASLKAAEETNQRRRAMLQARQATEAAIETEGNELRGLKEALAELPNVTEKAVASARKRVDTGVKKMADLEASVESKRRENVALTDDLDRLEAAKASLAALERQLGEASQPGPKADDLRAELQALRTQARELKADIEALRSGVCKTCGQSLTDRPEEEIKAELEEKTARMRALSKKASDLTNAIAQAEAVEEAARQLQDKLTRATESVSLLQARVEGKALHDITKEEAALTKAEGALRAAKSKLQQLESGLKKREETLRAVASAESRLAKLEADLAALEVPEEVDVATHKQQYEKAKAALDEVKSEMAGIRVTAASLSTEIKQAKSQLEATRKVAEQKKQAEIRKDLSKSLARFLNKNKATFLTQLWEGITAYASEFVSDCTGGRVEGLIHKDGGFFYIEDGQEMPAVAGSGSQQSIMGLGLQLALAELLPGGFGTLLLDEPSSDMDAEHALAVGARLAATGRQLLVVSHEELDGIAASNIITLRR